MKFILKVIVGFVLVTILIVVGIAALVGAGANQVQKDSNKQAITQKQYNSVPNGVTEKFVMNKFGKPTDRQVMKVQGAAKSTCIYYNRLNDLTSMYQFCFDGGKLTSKSLY